MKLLMKATETEKLVYILRFQKTVLMKGMLAHNRNFILNVYFYDKVFCSIKEDEIGGAYSMCEKHEKCITF
jgi:hypothetical protein